MKNTRKSINRGFIVLNKRERSAVISLLSLISILLAFSVFQPEIKLSKKERRAFHRLDSLIAVQEKALKEEEQAEAKKRAQNAFLAEQKTANKAQSSSKSREKQNVVAQAVEKQPKAYPKESKKIPILDINQADSLALVDLPQIGTVIASRIHRYRNRLGGFVNMDQLFEVKGMDTMRFETIKPYIVLETKEIVRINVNRDEFKTLLRHPYLEYEQVKAIVNHRERKGLIKDWEQLKEIAGDVNPFLEAYVCY